MTNITLPLPGKLYKTKQDITLYGVSKIQKIYIILNKGAVIMFTSSKLVNHGFDVHCYVLYGSEVWKAPLYSKQHVNKIFESVE